jgi:hypothetical protein
VNSKPRNRTYLLVATIVRAFMLGAAGVSFTHIVATAHSLGLAWEAWTVPLVVDGLAVLGLVGRSARFAPATQRAGLRLMVGAGLLSLACNVYAGHNLGQRLYGALIVAAFVVAEWYAAQLRPAPAKNAKRCPTGCTCRRHAPRAKKLTPAQKGAITRARKRAERELAGLREGPGSPAYAL